MKQSNYDNQLYLLRDLSVVELDESLLHLNLFDGNGLGGGGRPKRRLSLARPTATVARPTDRPTDRSRYLLGSGGVE